MGYLAGWQAPPLHVEKGTHLIASGEVVGLIGISRDLTQLKGAQTELERAILAIASHELKTPLTSMTLQVQSAKRGIERGDTAVYSKEKIDARIEQSDGN